MLDHNLTCRHLTDDQRRMVAARIANLAPHRPKETPAIGGTSVAKAADKLQVDHAGVERARRVVTKGAEELQAAVDQRKVTVRMVCACRAASGEQFDGRDIEFDGNEGSYAVGGFLQVTMLERDRARSWIAHRWPDRVGERIDPAAGEPMPPSRFRFRREIRAAQRGSRMVRIGTIAGHLTDDQRM